MWSRPGSLPSLSPRARGGWRVDALRPQPAYANTWVLHPEPMVAMADDVVAPQACDHIIERASSQIRRAKVSLDEQAAVVPGRSGFNCWLRYRDDPVVAELGERLAALVGLPLAHAEALQVIHYSPDQEYRPHYDAYDLAKPRGQRACRFGHQRIVTVLLYLNAVEEGGATHFPRLGLQVDPKPGRIVIFNNVGASIHEPHPLSLHAGLPVLRGEKWACNIWFHARPMRERQHFSLASGAVAAGSAPGLLVNRASRLFAAAFAGVQHTLLQRLGDQASSVCFTYWDTYGGRHLEPAQLQPFARVIRLIDRPISNPLAHKGQLARQLQAHGLRRWAPWAAESVAEALAHNPDPQALWFLKPMLLSGGRNMRCVRGSELAQQHQLPPHTLIQAAAADLELLHGRKFTVRVYVVIWDGQLYLYRDGFVLVHGVPYDATSTDYAVQIDHRGYEDPDSPVQMLPLSQFPQQARFASSVQALLIDLQPLFAPCLAASSRDRYLLLGIDLLYQRHGGVQLVEINTAPNFIHAPLINSQVNVPLFASLMELLMLGKREPEPSAGGGIGAFVCLSAAASSG